jgi:hypothetical protein
MNLLGVGGILVFSQLSLFKYYKYVYRILNALHESVPLNFWMPELVFMKLDM